MREKHPVTGIKIASEGIKGKIICGYQGWFAAAGDGTANAWFHWARGLPKKDFQSFELYPDMDEYDSTDLFETGYEPMPNGRTASLFSSSRISVTDLHFKWMNQYGIDGVALQRFMVATPGNRAVHINKVLENVILCAEKYGRIFYMCYDFSGFKSENFALDFINDFENTIVKQYGAVKSPAYLKVNGKPVVQLWGMGFTDRANCPDEYIKMIKHLKENGYYVIGGVPTHWRTGTKDSFDSFAEVYAMVDMVSPWLVGRFSSENGIISQYGNNGKPDIEFCKSRGQDYMPVIFPGFAWSNWHGGNRNSIPRMAGEFLRKQAVEAVKIGPEAIYVAMFDEYDEGTAIMKMATDSSAIPSNQYFLTGSADNKFLSSDYYLRLTGKINKIFRDEKEASSDFESDKTNIPFSEGPVYLRTSFEPDFDVYSEPSATCVNNNFNGTVKRINDGSVPVKSGKSSVQIKGNIEQNGMLSYKLLDVSYITGEPGMLLEYNIYIASGKNITLSVTADGGKKKLSKAAEEGLTGEWIKIKINLSELTGMQLENIIAECQSPGEIEAYLDDVSIYTDDESVREIYFAGGCFWGVEEYFSGIPGVYDVISGYANGKKENPSYEEVCYGNTGHIETVYVRYDPEKISLKILTEQYFKIINPVSTSQIQYRNGIYHVNNEDIPVISSVMADVQKNYENPLTVEVTPLKCFYPAEEYHQDYLKKNPGGHCHVS